MVAYRRGDAAAFRELFERYAPLLRRWLRRWVYSEDLIGDLVQQTFLQLHRARSDYREGAPLRPWIMTISHNLARELGRRKLRRPEVPMAMTAPGQPTATSESHARFSLRMRGSSAAANS